MDGRTEDVDPLCDRNPLDFALIEDLIEAASVLSTFSPLLPGRPDVEDRGLSVLPAPGILERRDDRRDLEESLVSERLMEG